MYTAPFKDGFLFTTSNDSQLFYYNFDEVKTFAGGDEVLVETELRLLASSNLLHHGKELLNF